nr:TVP38/TMEM64 family protein [Sedimentibacter sp.]
MKKKIITMLSIAVILILFKYYNVFDFFKFDNINDLKVYINSFGLLSPVVFILLFIVATIAFIPGLPITILAGVLFGTWWGTLYVIIGSTIGVSASFLIGRFLGRDFIKKMVDKNEKMKKLDSFISEQGNTILIISRLVPIFPFNLQNYAYGITDISFHTYFWYSLIFMIPGTFIYTCFGALAYSSIPTRDLVIYSSLLLIGLCCLVILPKKFFNLKKSSIN